MIADPVLSVAIPTFNNVAVLARCLESWRRFAADQPVELIVVEDGCRDGTPDLLAAEAATPWGRRHLRWVHEDNVHELRSTNRGFREGRGRILMTWQDDMFLRTPWFIPEVLRVFERHPPIGMLALSRGLINRPAASTIERWEDLHDERRMLNTIGPRFLNWFRIFEIDGVIRPWAVRRDCLDRVGMLDEAYQPTGWDESDLAYRIRGAGWHVAVHGYERDRAYVHLGSSTFTKYALNLERDLANGRRFNSQWAEEIRAGADRRRVSWARPMTPSGMVHTVMAIVSLLKADRPNLPAATSVGADG